MQTKTSQEHEVGAIPFITDLSIYHSMIIYGLNQTSNEVKKLQKNDGLSLFELDKLSSQSHVTFRVFR